MRYREGSEQLPLYSESAGLNDMLLFTVVLGLMIGIILTTLGYKGKQIWLTVWAGGLVICSLVYLGWHVMHRL